MALEKNSTSTDVKVVSRCVCKRVKKVKQDTRGDKSERGTLGKITRTHSSSGRRANGGLKGTCVRPVQECTKSHDDDERSRE